MSTINVYLKSVGMIVLLFTFSLALTSAREITCGDQPFNLWKFEEGTGVTTNESCYNYSAYFYNGMSWGEGVFGNATNFNGVDSYIYAGNVGAFSQNLTEFSFSLWVNVSNRTAYQSLFQRGNYYTDEFMEALQLNDGLDDYFIFMGASTLGVMAIDDGLWHNIIGTFNGSSGEVNIYIDSSFTANYTTAQTEIAPNSDILYFGANYANGYILNGTLDEIAFFNWTLSQTEVTDFFNPPSTPVISNVTATIITTNSIITWDTNISSNSTVCYWKTGFSAVCLSNSSNSTSHSVTITGLEEITWYNYFVRSCSSLCAQSANYTFYTSFNYTNASTISSVYVKDNQVFKNDGIKSIVALCFDNNSNFCNGLTECNISIWDSQGIVIVDNMAMTWFSTHYNYNITALTINGDYSSTVLCIGQNTAHTNFNFEINPNGEALSLSKTLFYLFLLSTLILFLIFSISKIFTLENYAWTILFVNLSYILFLSVTFIAYQLSTSFLTSISFISTILYVFFFITLIGLLPFFLYNIIYLLGKMLEEKEVKEMMGMGYNEDEAKDRVRKKRG